MEKQKSTLGGKRPNAGRPRLAEQKSNMTVRVTVKQRASYKAKGGNTWLCAALDPITKEETE